MAELVDSYVKLLLHFDGIDAAATDIDYSGQNHSLIFNADAQLDTARKKFGISSLLLDGSGDFLEISGQLSDFEFGSGDFTIDWYEYRVNTVNFKASVARDATTAIVPFMLGYSNGGALECYMSSDGSNWDIASAKSLGAISANQWVHLAVVRSGNNFYTFKDGVQQDTWASALAFNANANPLSIGKAQGGQYFPGSMDEWRISKGVARWTSAFTPVPYAYQKIARSIVS